MEINIKSGRKKDRRFFPDNDAVRESQIRRLGELRSNRDKNKVKEALAKKMQRRYRMRDQEQIHEILRCVNGITLSVISEKLGFWGASWYGKNWLERAGRMGQGQYRGESEGPKILGAGSGEPTLYLEVRRVVVRIVCHHFRWRCRGRGLFVSVQKNTLHKNPN